MKIRSGHGRFPGGTDFLLNATHCIRSNLGKIDTTMSVSEFGKLLGCTGLVYRKMPIGLLVLLKVL
jgi:hypothetical protein